MPLYKHVGLDQHVSEMKSFGDTLVPYNFPLSSENNEEIIGCLKTRVVTVDGYEIVASYSKSDYGDYYLESCTVEANFAPFLPFCIVCKVGNKFLGNQHLNLVELFRDNRKVYYWSVGRDHDGNAIPYPQLVESEPCNYEGFSYMYINPTQVNFH